MITAIQGLPGSGKSYFAVNVVIRDFLLHSERKIYTNLPLNRDSDGMFIVAKCGRSEKWRSRHERIVEMGNRVVDGRHEQRDFWHFTDANAVVVLDEVAKLWSSEDKRAGLRPKDLTQYLNEHRHLKDDLIFLYQVPSDVDVSLRRKMNYVWQLRNSLNENIVDHWLFRGMTWPVQFFIARQYRGAPSTREGVDSIGELHKTLRIKPTPAGYSSYNSFSQTGNIIGKAPPPDGAESGDIKTSSGRWEGVLMGIPVVLAVVVAGVIGVWVVVTQFGKIIPKASVSTGMINESEKTMELAMEMESVSSGVGWLRVGDREFRAGQSYGGFTYRQSVRGYHEFVDSFGRSQWIGSADLGRYARSSSVGPNNSVGSASDGGGERQPEKGVARIKWPWSP